MWTVAVVVVLAGIIALLSYKRGRGSKEIEVLEDEIQSNKERRRIANLSDSNLDDELRDHWS